MIKKGLFAFLVSAFIGSLAGCNRSNPVAPKKPTMNGTWKWYSIELPKSPWPDTSIVRTIDIKSANGTISCSQKFSDGSSCTITGKDTYPTATLDINFGHGAEWESNCTYITSDSVVGIDLGVREDTLGSEIFTRVN